MENIQASSTQDWACDYKVVDIDESTENVEVSFKEAKTSTRTRSRGKPTPCPICGVIIANSYSFTCHMRRHRNDKPFKCNQCPASFILQHELKVHSIIHSDQYNFKCTMCDKSFKTKSGKRCHEDSHGLNEYTCRYCPEKFSKFIVRSKHETSIHKKGEFKCSYCYKKFINQEFKMDHEASVHNKPKVVKQKQTKRTITAKSNTAKSMPDSHDNKIKTPYFRCKICSERFSFRKDQISHIYDVHPGQVDKLVRTCNICDKKFTGHYFMYHMKAHVGVKPHACPLCDFKAPRKDELKTQMAVHSDATPFLCSHCGKRFKSKRSWELCEAKHAGKKEQICEICDKTFFTNTVLARHITQVHSKKKCHICGIEVSPLYLSTHIKKEHSEKCSEVCDQCGKTYSNKSSFNYHLRTHSKEISSEPKLQNSRFCPYCDYQASSRSGLLRHCSSSHPSKIFKCKICPYMNLNSNKHDEHMRTHMKDSSYEIFFSVSLESTLERERERSIQECFICGFQSVFEYKMNEHFEKHEITFQKLGGLKRKYEKNLDDSTGINMDQSVNEVCTLNNLIIEPDNFEDEEISIDDKLLLRSQLMTVPNANSTLILSNCDSEAIDVKDDKLIFNNSDIKLEEEVPLPFVNSRDVNSLSKISKVNKKNPKEKQNSDSLKLENKVPTFDIKINKFDLNDKLQTINGKKFIALEDLLSLRNLDIKTIFKQVNNAPSDVNC